MVVGGNLSSYRGPWLVQPSNFGTNDLVPNISLVQICWIPILVASTLLTRCLTVEGDNSECSVKKSLESSFLMHFDAQILIILIFGDDILILMVVFPVFTSQLPSKLHSISPMFIG